MTSSSDEGEILEHDSVNLKATSSPKKLEGNGVDRPDRLRDGYSRSRSPEHANGSSPRHYRSSRYSRSPPPRALKRPRDDRDHRRHKDDMRRFWVHYEDYDRDSSYRRSRLSYDDIDRSPDRDLDRDRDRDRPRDKDRDRNRYTDKRARVRSPSPFGHPHDKRLRDDRYRRDDGRLKGRPDGSSRESGPEDQKERVYRNGHTPSARATVGEDSRNPRYDAKPRKGHADETQQASQQEPEPEPDFEKKNVIDEDAEIERRRRRRAELLAKSSSATPLLVHAVHAADRSSVSSPGPTQQTTPASMDVDTSQSGMAFSFYRFPYARSPSSPPAERSPDLDIMNETDLMNRHAVKDPEDDGPSAANYDPTLDMKEDEKRDGLRHGNVGLHGEVQPQTLPLKPKDEDEVQNKAPKDDDDDDMDMFADDFDEEKYAAPKPTKATTVVEKDTESPALGQQPPGGGLLEDDDKDGYYKIRIGEVMNGRYQVQSMLGRGMFSGVARALDITTKKLVAIKIMRNNDALRKGGFTEISILQKLNDADPDNRKHIIKFERHFDHKGHLCMTFENLSLNLREVLRKFGNNVGINLNATRAYAHQIFVGLAHMRKCSVIHADLKPDNILVNESRNLLKICDLGTAIDKSDAATAHNEITPYLVSRFYRAPEIILGMPYDYAVDMWSIGCTLYELYTGKILFTGNSNNQMLKAIMEIRGKITPKLYKRGELSGMHFDDLGNFLSVEHDKALEKTTVRTLAIVKPTRDLRTRLMAASAGMDDAESRDLNHFIDLLEHCLALNPEKRIKPLDALKHPFFTSRTIARR
ncbi:kinase-like protein [Sodiomyces alkalinus F11]|uniref:non-specific serine/threonine protein kinase n=1 Tax=Sodiomyces alkalinus (strain CBS 110278 / VKM F-3762 / F11) TaxID=1314773 RepID=A0A3N2PJT4_SODAK|nr:kinase-like protein [Sodiomyces alkalinus F11]ROT34785.1 kinase-like protein [Sodiomyces alkalinus F11]